MALKVTGQQPGVEVPSWFLVLRCPKCHAKEVPFTLRRYGQSSSRVEDQTMTGLPFMGFGAGLHTNRMSLVCRCGYEEFFSLFNFPCKPKSKSALSAFYPASDENFLSQAEISSSSILFDSKKSSVPKTSSVRSSEKFEDRILSVTEVTKLLSAF